jgi:hypothetical protein
MVVLVRAHPDGQRRPTTIGGEIKFRSAATHMVSSLLNNRTGRYTERQRWPFSRGSLVTAEAQSLIVPFDVMVVVVVCNHVLAICATCLLRCVMLSCHTTAISSAVSKTCRDQPRLRFSSTSSSSSSKSKPLPSLFLACIPSPQFLGHNNVTGRTSTRVARMTKVLAEAGRRVHGFERAWATGYGQLATVCAASTTSRPAVETHERRGQQQAPYVQMLVRASSLAVARCMSLHITVQESR